MGKFFILLRDIINKLNSKATLVDGKVPKEQLPDDIGEVDLSNYYTKTEIDEMIGDCEGVINSINTLVGGESE